MARPERARSSSSSKRRTSSCSSTTTASLCDTGSAGLVRTCFTDSQKRRVASESSKALWAGEIVPTTAVWEFPAKACPSTIVSLEFLKWCHWLPSLPPAPVFSTCEAASSRTQRAKWKSDRLIKVSSLKRSVRHMERRSCSRPARSTSMMLLLDCDRSIRRENIAWDLEEHSFNMVAAVVLTCDPKLTKRSTSSTSSHGTSSTPATKAPNRGWKCTVVLLCDRTFCRGWPPLPPSCQAGASFGSIGARRSRTRSLWSS
mmetsp:Transcript_72040/g.159087  ORF Transcript_72040/g.159087 Transcript_72040/m.159087 type:complete len:258 (+) Transcript_72040:1685-2458(+)